MFAKKGSASPRQAGFGDLDHQVRILSRGVRLPIPVVAPPQHRKVRVELGALVKQQRTLGVGVLASLHAPSHHASDCRQGSAKGLGDFAISVGAGRVSRHIR
jgi:hypothetical protein